jgi:hypothetical protein
VQSRWRGKGNELEVAALFTHSLANEVGKCVDRDETGGLTQYGWTLKGGSVAAASSTGQLDNVSFPYGRCGAQSRRNSMGSCLREEEDLHRDHSGWVLRCMLGHGQERCPRPRFYQPPRRRSRMTGPHRKRHFGIYTYIHTYIHTCDAIDSSPPLGLFFSVLSRGGPVHRASVAPPRRSLPAVPDRP